jgi:hypothetical protein
LGINLKIVHERFRAIVHIFLDYFTLVQFLAIPGIFLSFLHKGLDSMNFVLSFLASLFAALIAGIIGYSIRGTQFKKALTSAPEKGSVANF